MTSYTRKKTANCSDCDVAILSGTKTGRCRTCNLQRFNSDPEFLAAKAAGNRKKWEDPAFVAKMRRLLAAVGRRNGTDPAIRAKLSELGKQKVEYLHSPENRAKAKLSIGKGVTEAKMAWCPKEYWEQYFFLTRRKKFRADEARAVIFATIRADREKAQASKRRALDTMTPFERQQRALENGARLVANDIKPSLANPGIYEERKAG